MTQEQKLRITELRCRNVGYAAIARELGLSVNTIKAYCRRNDLAGTRDSIVSPIRTLSEDESDIRLISDAKRGNTTNNGCSKSIGNTAFSGIQSGWEVSVSYSEKPDAAAIADVMSILMNASFGR